MLKHGIAIGLAAGCAGLVLAAAPGWCQGTGAEAPVGRSVEGVAPSGDRQQMPGNTGIADGEESEAARARRVVQDELEQLRAEIAMLKVLSGAQDALFAWNSLRVKSGEKPTGLDGALCEKVRPWCDVLPASFGRMAGKGPE